MAPLCYRRHRARSRNGTDGSLDSPLEEDGFKLLVPRHKSSGFPARDAGLRIDHLLLSPGVAKRLIAAGVDREVRGGDYASDHAPA